MTDQLVRIHMTLQTLPVLPMNRLGMRQAMTILANWNGRMLALVAIGTIYPTMIRVRISKIAGNICMTNPAK